MLILNAGGLQIRPNREQRNYKSARTEELQIRPNRGYVVKSCNVG